MNFIHVTPDELLEITETEARLRESIRTPYHQRTPEQAAIAKSWRKSERARSAAWWAKQPRRIVIGGES